MLQKLFSAVSHTSSGGTGRLALVCFLSLFLMACGDGTADTNSKTATTSITGTNSSNNTTITATTTTSTATNTVTVTGTVTGSITSTITGTVTGTVTATATVTEPAWQAATLVENINFGYAETPQVAVDSKGNIIAVWSQQDVNLQPRIYVNRYNTSTFSWGTPQPIDAAPSGESAALPKLAVDAAGNAIAVWQESATGLFNLWASRYNVLTGVWSVPRRIESDVFYPNTPQLAMDPAGNATVVWARDTGGQIDIMANRFSITSNLWGTATHVDGTTTAGFEPHVAMDSSGNAMAVWQMLDGTTVMVYASRRTAASSVWSTPVAIETNQSGNSSNAQIAIDSAGNAIAAWQKFDGITSNIWVNRYSAGSWGTAQVIELSDGEAFYPTIAFDNKKNAVVAWQQFDITFRGYQVNTARYSFVGNNWAAPVTISNDTGNALFQPRLAIDATDNVVAVWEQSDLTLLTTPLSNIYANRYNASTGQWGAATLLENSNAGDAGEPKIAISPQGKAMAVWSQSDGTRFNIYASYLR